jgi:hypothetical protein
MTDQPNGIVMQGARAAFEDGLLHIEEHIEGIERAVAENTGLAFDLAKNIVESTCQTILKERQIPYAHDDDLPKLINLVLNNIPLLPASANGSPEARQALVRTISGLKTAVQGICELRNECGFASHGSDSPRPKLEPVQAMLAAESADALVGFLFRVHRQDHAAKAKPRLRYPDHEDFNAYVDSTHEPVRILNEEFLPSRVLFEMAPEPYRTALAEYPPESESKADEPEDQPVVIPAQATVVEQAAIGEALL